MREIKFRAWNTVEKTMGEPFTLQEAINPRMGCYVVTENAIYMQDTGLKDKKGKEIYFGDILATSNNNPDYDLWSEGDFGFTVVKERPDELGVYYSNWEIAQEDEIIYSNMFVEVVGNIYENPELLK